jgi:pimeloyl-ACP methyl ester carboxylesterase
VTEAERAAALLTAAGSDVSLVVEPGVGHLLPVTAPARLHRAVAAMISR